MVIFEHVSCVVNKPSGNLSSAQTITWCSQHYLMLTHSSKSLAKESERKTLIIMGISSLILFLAATHLILTKWHFCDNVIWATFEHVHISFTSANQVEKVEYFVVMCCPPAVYMIGPGFLFSFRIHFWIIFSHIWMQRFQPTKSHLLFHESQSMTGSRKHIITNGKEHSNWFWVKQRR